MPVPPEYYLFLSAALFAIGLCIVLVKKNVIVVLMGIELILNAANINLVAFSRQSPDLFGGQMFALFVIVVAAAESAVALAIIIKVYQFFKTAELGEIGKRGGKT